VCATLSSSNVRNNYPAANAVSDRTALVKIEYTMEGTIAGE